MKTLFCVVLLLAASGCHSLRPAVVGSGIAQTEYRPLPPFEEIELSGFGTVNVVPSQQTSVHVTTDDNLLTLVETSVQNGCLKIRPAGRIRPSDGLVIDVGLPSIKAASVSGAGDIHLDGIVGDELDLSISGAGDMTANGQVRHVSTRISGAGSADLEELYAETAKVKISGAGNVSVFATESVDARVSGAGNVTCYGNPPQVSQRISGIGNVSLR